MDLANLFYELSDHNRTVLIFLVYFAILIIGYRFLSEKKRLNEYLRAIRWRASFCLMIFGHIFLILEYRNIIYIKNICTWQLAVANIVLDMLLLVNLKFFPSRIQKKLDRLKSGWGVDLIEEYKELQSMKLSHMTPKEQLLWNRKYYINLYMIGSVNKSIEIMEKTEEKDSVRSRMLYSLRAETLGNVDDARKEMIKAIDAIGPGEEALRVQLYNDIARCDQFCENSDQALRYFSKAADSIDSKTDIFIIHIVYSNLIGQSCVMGCPEDEIRRLLEQYKYYINNKNLEDVIEYNNTEMLVAREKGDIQRQKELIEQGYNFLYPKLAKSNKKKAIAYNVSVLKMAHMAQMSPEKYLNVVKEEWECICKMPYHEKYYLMKELWIFKIEPPQVTDQLLQKYAEIFSYVENYIKNEAEMDLENYLKEIPDETIYAQGHTLQEIVWLQKWKDNYDFSVVHRKMRSVIDLYRSHSLRLEAVIVAGNLIDELLSVQNLCDGYTLKYPDIMEEELKKLSAEMQNVRAHAGMAEVYLKISYGYVYIHAYEAANKYYNEFLKCGMNPNHFSVWTKYNLQFIQMVCKIWRIKAELLSLKENAQKDTNLSEESKEWLKNYPDISSEEMVVLTAIALKQEVVNVKIVGWVEQISSGIMLNYNHWWMVWGETEVVNDENAIMEIDLCYNQISEKGDMDKLIFYPGMHPLEVRNEQWVRTHVCNLPGYGVYMDRKYGKIAGFTEARFQPVQEIGKRLRDI
ncbi:hypothetical protein GT671_11680 [Blautia obeum]|uniref:Uncharacterized protein n=1 Tax=Blautia obeum TaxID=40520 RepID=A0A4Q5GDL5_9FIRM|nr:hypothetical protein [Blautia obeum]MZT69820.1 hypothetical protein [Blautia obeum]RYT65309.1 hypothetical protein EAI82_11520 [Blautia obeum]